MENDFCSLWNMTSPGERNSDFYRCSKRAEINQNWKDHFKKWVNLLIQFLIISQRNRNILARLTLFEDSSRVLLHLIWKQVSPVIRLRNNRFSPTLRLKIATQPFKSLKEGSSCATEWKERGERLRDRLLQWEELKRERKWRRWRFY